MMTGLTTPALFRCVGAFLLYQRSTALLLDAKVAQEGPRELALERLVIFRKKIFPCSKIEGHSDPIE
ncbi:MAG: hypothetical protein JWM08_2339 [Candidatus Angelobacter sp.]|nr:hypothetical protein [Candidatus Angelobacter sp.]